MRTSLSLAVLLLSLAVNVDGFVFSCEEVKYRLANSNLEEDTTHICVVPQENYTSVEVLQNIFAQNDKVSSSFYDISQAPWLQETPHFCISRVSSSPWRIVTDNVNAIDCSQEFTLIFTSQPYIFVDRAETVVDETGISSATEMLQTLVSPRTGFAIRVTDCGSNDPFSIYSGVGTGVAEFRYPIASWNCREAPNLIVSFENAITIGGTFVWWQYASYNASDYGEIGLKAGDRVAIMSSGRSDNLQNYRPNTNYAQFTTPPRSTLDLSCSISLDKAHGGSVSLTYSKPGKQITYELSTESMTIAQADSFMIEYTSTEIGPANIWNNQDTFVVEVTVGDPLPVTPATPTEPGPYCQCPVDRFFFPDGWDSNQIWIDVVIILDTTVAMGKDSLSAAAYQIESFIDGNLITDTRSSYYTRIGLIAMSDRPEIIYDLNMTSSDTVVNKVSIKNVDAMDVTGSIQAAEEMFNRGLVRQPDRVNTKQVIYYMTDSDPSANLNPANQFKISKGVIIVNNFIEEGEVERPGLKNLSSPGFYYSDLQENYMKTIQAFCLANCFCPGDKDAYGGMVEDPQMKPNGGCFHPVPAGVPFSKAKASCASNAGGIIATIHDEKKANFVNGLMRNVIAAGKTYFFWIGYSKGDDNQFHWEDNSTDPYVNWDTNEPSNAAIAKCVFVDESNSNLPWGAGNCQIGFPYVCEYAPCGVGNKNCIGITP